MSTQSRRVITVKEVDFVIDDEKYRVEKPPQWLFDNQDFIFAAVDRMVDLIEEPISEMVMTLGLVAFGLISELGNNQEFWIANLKAEDDTFFAQMSRIYDNAYQIIFGTDDDTETGNWENCDFYRKMITSIMNLAWFDIKPDDIVEVDDFDPDRLYFTLANGDCSFFLRLWNMSPSGIEYTLYKENDMNSADQIIDGYYPCEVSIGY